MEKIAREARNKKSRPKAAFLSASGDLNFSHHLHGDVREHVRVKLDRDRELADVLERAGGHANLRLLHLQALLAERLGDVRVGDGAEQATVDASLLRDLDLHAFELGAALLCGGQLLVGLLLEIGAAALELLEVRL